jgi:hypothetical protein
MQFFSTSKVAKILGMKSSTLSRAVWAGDTDSPDKSPSGDFLWTPKDIERAAVQLHRFNRLPVIKAIQKTSEELQ